MYYRLKEFVQLPKMTDNYTLWILLETYDIIPQKIMIENDMTPDIT